MNTAAVADKKTARTFALVEPLDWSQLRALLWEACEPNGSNTDSRWEDVASLVNQRCPESTPQSAETYREVFERVASQIPEARDIFESPGAGQRLWTKLLYEIVFDSLMFKPVFMNLGFAEIDPESKPLVLDSSEEPFRLFIRLYQHVLEPAKLEGADVLEVGCGAGGGARFMMNHYHPKSLVGIDLVEVNIAAAQAPWAIPGLTYQLGDAAALPFPDNSFDVVVNIESSHCYPSMRQFLSEVKRVLRPNGMFLFADHRPIADEWGNQRTVATLHEDLRQTGMKIERDENITSNINAASEMLHKGKEFMMSMSSIKGFRRVRVEEIRHCRGSRNYKKLMTEAWQYRCYALRKNPA
jgi:ubiquinone/menaquinone biosynthesis C-methylase UbiE